MSLEALQGWKSYITAALILASGIALKFHWIDGETFAMLLAALNGGAVAALRAGMSTETRKTFAQVVSGHPLA